MTSKLRQLRHVAFFQQGGRRHYCDAPMWLNDCAQFAATYQLTRRQAMLLQCTAEHLIARCDGGRHTRPTSWRPAGIAIERGIARATPAHLTNTSTQSALELPSDGGMSLSFSA